MRRDESHVAYLSNTGDCIHFSFRDKNIRFKGPYSLMRFAKVKKWDHGYIVVDAVFQHSSQPIEDYIDLVPILKNLYIDADEFLSNIQKVELKDA